MGRIDSTPAIVHQSFRDQTIWGGLWFPQLRPRFWRGLEAKPVPKLPRRSEGKATVDTLLAWVYEGEGTIPSS